MKYWLAILLPLAVDVSACTMPAWLKDGGPGVPPRTFDSALDGNPNQNHAMRARDAGSDGRSAPSLSTAPPP